MGKPFTLTLSLAAQHHYPPTTRDFGNLPTFKQSHKGVIDAGVLPSPKKT